MRLSALPVLSIALALSACGGRTSPQAGTATTDPATGLRLRFVPPGSFLMGSPESEAGRHADELPHRVTLTRGFWLGETEITQETWRRLAGGDPSFLGACGPLCPVERVSWFEAVAFANLASEAASLSPCYELDGCSGTLGGGCDDGQGWCTGDFRCAGVVYLGPGCDGYRLPTEAEWEYAARAGTTTATYTGNPLVDGLNSAPALDQIAVYGGNSGVSYAPAWDCSDWKEKQEPASRCGTQPVAGRLANPWNLHDMLGNVWEWTWDAYGPYPETPSTDPLGPDGGNFRVRRGCSWSNIPRHCRVADRSNDSPEVRDRNWGFRLARTADCPAAGD